jgi:hypothetical protein
MDKPSDKAPVTPKKKRRRGRSSASSTPGGKEATDDEEARPGSLADDNDNDDDLGLFRPLVEPPPTGWTKETKPTLPACPPRTNITRFSPRTKITFGWALVYYYDESTRYALRWHEKGMTHPTPGQRNGKRLGPSKGGNIDYDVLKT